MPHYVDTWKEVLCLWLLPLLSKDGAKPISILFPWRMWRLNCCCFFPTIPLSPISLTHTVPLSPILFLSHCSSLTHTVPLLLFLSHPYCSSLTVPLSPILFLSHCSSLTLYVAQCKQRKQIKSAQSSPCIPGGY